MAAIRAAVALKKEQLVRCIPGIVWLFHLPCQYSESMWTCTIYWKLQFFLWAEIFTFAWSNSFDLYRCDASNLPVVIKVHCWDWDIFLPKLLKFSFLRWTSDILRGTCYPKKQGQETRVNQQCLLRQKSTAALAEELASGSANSAPAGQKGIWWEMGNVLECVV